VRPKRRERHRIAALGGWSYSSPSPRFSLAFTLTCPRRGRIARCVLLAMGALIGTSLVGAANPAAALACTSYHTNMDAYDATALRFGIGGENYVNDSTTLGNLQSADYRSFFVWHDNTDWTEVGWGANAYGHASPTEYTFWDNNGAEPNNGQPNFFSSLSYNTNYQFKNQDQNGDKIFHFYGANGAALDNSPVMGFYKGDILTNSEHYNSCDSLWAHMYNLAYYNENLTWVSPLGNLQPWYCNSNGNWLLNVISNSELYVDQNAGVNCG
jgi:hypothetical protein